MSERQPKPDISFKAKVKADELHVKVAPESRVEFPGDTGEDSTSGSTRTNLPDRVDEGTTYRDIEIDYEIKAILRPETAAGGNTGGRPPRS